MTKEETFFNALRDVFVGAKVEGESGYVNLMRIKARYYEQGVFPELQKDIAEALKPFPEFREELFDRLYTFFHRYFSESGSIYFRYTPLHEKVYEQVYTDDRDVMLFWKTQMLYYVKTDRLFRSIEVEVDGFRFSFDVSRLEHKKANEKRALVYTFKECQEDGSIVFDVTYSEKGRKTKLDDTRRAIKNALELPRYTEMVPSEETLERAFRVFERQSEVDYFICKDAKKFLREQFDLSLYQYVFEPEQRNNTVWNERRICQLQVLKDIAYKIIDFIAQFEDELVKIWNKPKFVLNANYVITLDRIAMRDGGMALLERLLTHLGMEQQVQEWRDLGMVENGFTPDQIWVTDLLGRHLHERYQHLPLDTRYFKDLEPDILALFDYLDQEIDGWLIKSENYQALNTLLSKFRERVQTIYIDPPFNLETNADFFYSVKYKDSTWVTILENRLELARNLLDNTGSIFVRCDYNGNMLVRLLMNRIFSEENFGNEIVINRFRRQLRETTRLNVATDSLFYYQKTNRCLFTTTYRRRICSFCGQEIEPEWRYMHSPGLRYPPERVICGRKLLPPKGRHWTFAQAKIEEMEAEGRIRINESIVYTDLEGNKVRGMPEYLQTEETPVDSLWTDLKGYVFGSKFSTENPEELLKRVIEISSNEGTIIMDFFLGSGTTTATAHKLGRKWLGVEMDEHFYTMILPRMKKVLWGEQSGISREVNWQGGGFFKYFELEQYEDVLRRACYEDAESLFIQSDPYSQYVFLRDKKMLDNAQTGGQVLTLDVEKEEIRVDLTKLYDGIDLAETLSCVTGEWIRRIHLDSNDPSRPGKVEFEDGTMLNLANPSWELVKPLIWW